VKDYKAMWFKLKRCLKERKDYKAMWFKLKRCLKERRGLLDKCLQKKKKNEDFASALETKSERLEILLVLYEIETIEKIGRYR